MPKLAPVADTVKHGAVVIEVREYADGRYGFDGEIEGRPKRWRCKLKDDALRLARERARLLNAGRVDLLNVKPDELQQFREWKRARTFQRTAAEVLTDFLTLKRSDAELNAGHIGNLDRWLTTFAEACSGEMREITAAQIEAHLAGLGKAPRNRNNIRDAIVALFRFARQREYLPDKTTEAEKVGRLKARGSEEVSTYSPEELLALLAAAREPFLPWVAIGAFSGIRTEEIRPKSGSAKDPLRWEDFAWTDGYIRVRADTAKTGHGRIVPLLPALSAYLAPWRAATGPVLEGYVFMETRRLKEAGVTYRKNALRHSFGSYRLAVVKSIAQVAEEMGNSPAMIRKEYQTPMPDGLAVKWFALRPELPANVRLIA